MLTYPQIKIQEQPLLKEYDSLAYLPVTLYTERLDIELPTSGTTNMAEKDIVIPTSTDERGINYSYLPVGIVGYDWDTSSDQYEELMNCHVLNYGIGEPYEDDGVIKATLWMTVKCNMVYDNSTNRHVTWLPRILYIPDRFVDYSAASNIYDGDI